MLSPARSCDQLLAVELPAEHGRHLHHALRLRPETVEARADELLDGPRHADLVDRPGEAHLAVAAQEIALLDERARDLLGEERVALGLLHDAALELSGERAAGDGADDLDGLVVRERAERELRERRLARATPAGTPADG